MAYYNGPTPNVQISGRARQRYVKRRTGAATAMVRGCLVLFTLCVMGMLFFVLVMGPVMFRLLPYGDQDRVARRVGLLSPWMYTATPTLTFVPSPTVDQSRLNAGLDLLDDGTATPLFGATPQGAQPNAASGAGPAATPTLVPGAPEPTVVALAPTRNPATDIPLPATFHMTRYQWVPQKWNNCGPANLTQVLNGYGVTATQEDLAGWLKPNANDANVSPWQLVSYVNTKLGGKYKAISRVNGSLKLIKSLMVAKFRPIIETGLLSPKDGSWEGHYLTPIGYDDNQGILYGLDSLIGAGKDNQGVREEYNDLDSRWGQFNRIYVVVYPAEREAELKSILGTDADATQNVKTALARANQDRKTNPADPYAWFNVGMNYVLLKDYRQAAAAFDQARTAGGGLPWRMLWYQFGLFSAYYNIGDYQTALAQVESTLSNQKNVEELFYWRGLVRSALGQSSDAQGDLLQALTLNGNFKPAQEALNALNGGQKPAVFDSP